MSDKKEKEELTTMTVEASVGGIYNIVANKPMTRDQMRSFMLEAIVATILDQVAAATKEKEESRILRV